MALDSSQAQLPPNLYPSVVPVFHCWCHDCSLQADYKLAAVSRPDRDFEDLNLVGLDSRSMTLEIVEPCCEAIREIEGPCEESQNQMVNTEHYVALWVQSIDALAIENDREQIQNGVEREQVVRRDFRRAYNDKD